MSTRWLSASIKLPTIGWITADRPACPTNGENSEDHEERAVVLAGRSKENGQQVGRKGKQETLTSSKILASPFDKWMNLSSLVIWENGGGGG